MKVPCILIIFLAGIIFSCKKDNESIGHYIFRGMVIDQVTRDPVEGATVNIAILPFCERNKIPDDLGETYLTGKDGRFEIRVAKKAYEERTREPGCPIVYAEMPGYKGSNLAGIPDAAGADEIVITLFHPSELNLHVRRETLDNVDSIQIWISRFSLFALYPIEFTVKCKGEQYDSLLVFRNLWSNEVYNLQSGPIGRISIIKYYSRKIISLVPNEIVHLDLSFGYDKDIPPKP